MFSNDREWGPEIGTKVKVPSSHDMGQGPKEGPVEKPSLHDKENGPEEGPVIPSLHDRN